MMEQALFDAIWKTLLLPLQLVDPVSIWCCLVLETNTELNDSAKSFILLCSLDEKQQRPSVE